MISLLSETLLHFLWQGTALALLLALFLKLARRAAPSARYLASSATLLLMVVAPVLTFLFVAKTSDGFTPDLSPPAFSPEANLNLASVPPIAAPTAEISKEATVLTPSVPAWSQWVVGCWLAGMLLLSLRFVLNWVCTHRLRCSGTLVTNPKLRSEFDQLCRSLGLRRPIPLLESTRCLVPMVIGCWKPVVLVPAGLLTGTPSEYLRAIFTHELAHIRRHDYLVNLLQHLVEALLFFHPAVWWTSRQLRRERELCCDDHAATSHGVLTYCEALLTLERQLGSGTPPQLAPAANGSKLLGRINRLAQRGPEYRSPAPAAFLTLLIPILAIGSTFLSTQAEQAQVPEQLALPRTDAAEEPVKAKKGPAALEVLALTDKHRETLSWGKEDKAGLRAAISLQPRRDEYPAHTKITSHYLIGNFGKKPVSFQAGHYLQPDSAQLEISLEGGDRNELGSIQDDGATALLDVTLKAGQYVRIPASPLFLSDIPRGEGVSPSGTYLGEQPGQRVTMVATITAHSHGKLRTGSVKVTVANPKAAKPPAKTEPIPVQDPKPPKLDQRPLSRADIQDKILSLTFIAGPHRTNTPALLDLLKEHKIKATFFVLGKHAELYPKIIERMVKEGHEVGNNSMNHPHFKNLTDEEILEEIRATQKAIRRAAPVVPTYFRPPYGSITPEQQTLIQTKLGIVAVLWSIDSRDWLRHEPKVTAKRVIDAAHPGGIVLLHDIHKPTVEATRLIIEGLKKIEYRFTTVGSLDMLQEMKRK